jgi:xeroderma pigmentosum group C-complementing protein
MLAEAAVTDPGPSSDRPLKRRRVAREVNISTDAPSSEEIQAAHEQSAEDDHSQSAARLQTLEVSSDDEDESDFEFEDVDLDGPVHTHDVEDDSIADISIAINPTATPKRRVQTRRKPHTAVEKACRLLTHQLHVLCLLGHCMYINGWCNTAARDPALARSLTPSLKVSFRSRPGASQFEQNKAFMKALEQSSEDFSFRFVVTSSGIRKARWKDDGADDVDDDLEADPVDKAEFFRAAKTMQGSQDTGNQLFCALLRSLGVEARLVCSLQPLPFTSKSSKGSTPQKIFKPSVHAIAPDTDPEKSEASTDDAAVGSSKSIGKVPSVRRRLGQPTLTPAASAMPPTSEKKRPVRALAYPVFWVEAFNTAHQKWIPVDPLVTGTVNKSTRLEPPSSYELNQMSYVIAFEDDGVAKDVTRRYAKAYNAKTRRQRVEAAGEAGTRWWKKIMRFFRRQSERLDRDQVEDAELGQKEAREGMPANVQDFKEHPVYALERHLKRHEVIHPRREIGKVNAGTAAKPRMEVVFRRSDVLACRSADKWYRLGRVIKEGEQPLKHITSNRIRQRERTPDQDEDEEAERRTALYSLGQTELYVPPAVSASGRIPRNAFSNLDIYVPSMVPGGGVHVSHPLTADAAKALKIDYADAVTGFTFKGRQGTAVIQGAIVARQYEDAVRAVISGLEYERELERSRQRSLVALTLWKRFLTGLRIEERVAAYGDPKSGKGKKRLQGDGDDQDEDGSVGGFLLRNVVENDEELLTAGQSTYEELVSAVASGKKATPKKKKKKVDSDEEEEYMETPAGGDGFDDQGDGGFLAEDAVEPEGPGGFIADDENEDNDDGEDGPEAANYSPSRIGHVDDELGGFIADDAGEGYFIPEDGNQAEEEAGGFLPEEDVQLDGEYDDAFVMGDAVDHVRSVGYEDHGGEDENDLQMHGALRGLVDTDGAENGPVDSTENGLPEKENADGDLDAVAAGVDGEKPDAEKDVQQHAAKEDSEGDEMADDDSLVSQDPEDEDAEPDWLESD